MFDTTVNVNILKKVAIDNFSYSKLKISIRSPSAMMEKSSVKSLSFHLRDTGTTYNKSHNNKKKCLCTSFQKIIS